MNQNLIDFSTFLAIHTICREKFMFDDTRNCFYNLINSHPSKPKKLWGQANNPATMKLG